MAEFKRDRAAAGPRRMPAATAHDAIFEKVGAGEGNRTLVISLEGCCSTIELHPHLLDQDIPKPQRSHRFERRLRESLDHINARARLACNRRTFRVFGSEALCCPVGPSTEIVA